MKILFCPAHFRFTDSAGSEFYSVYNNAHRIASSFKESVVVTGKSDMKSAPYRIIETQKNKGRDWMLDLSQWSTLSSILFTISYTKTGYSLLRSEKFDIIHHVRPFAIENTFNILPFLPAYRKTPFVIGEFCSTYASESLAREQKFSTMESSVRTLTSLAQPVLRFLSLMTLRRADAILVTDQNTKKILLAKKILPERIFIIPHGKDKTEYCFNEQKFQDGNVRVLVAGRLIRRKRIDLALQAFAVALKSNGKLILTIAGDGPEKENLENLAEELKIEKGKVEFLGAVPYKDMPKVFSRAHIFLHTAADEAFGQVYIEALASGVPIITTSTTGAKNIIKKSFGFVAADNTDALASSLVMLSRDKEKLTEMSIAAREEFLNLYDLDSVIIPQIMSIYDKVMNSGD